VCTKEEEGLKEVTLSELKRDEIEKDTILWVKTISNPCQIVAVIIIVEDKNKEVISLSLYNQVGTSHLISMEEL